MLAISANTFSTSSLCEYCVDVILWTLVSLNTVPAYLESKFYNSFFSQMCPVACFYLQKQLTSMASMSLIDSSVMTILSSQHVTINNFVTLWELNDISKAGSDWAQLLLGLKGVVCLGEGLNSWISCCYFCLFFVFHLKKIKQNQIRTQWH